MAGKRTITRVMIKPISEGLSHCKLKLHQIFSHFNFGNRNLQFWMGGISFLKNTETGRIIIFLDYLDFSFQLLLGCHFFFLDIFSFPDFSQGHSHPVLQGSCNARDDSPRIMQSLRHGGVSEDEEGHCKWINKILSLGLPKTYKTDVF